MTALPILRDIVFGVQDPYSVLDLSRTESARIDFVQSNYARGSQISLFHGQDEFDVSFSHSCIACQSLVDAQLIKWQSTLTWLDNNIRVWVCVILLTGSRHCQPVRNVVKL